MARRKPASDPPPWPGIDPEAGYTVDDREARAAALDRRRLESLLSAFDRRIAELTDQNQIAAFLGRLVEIRQTSREVITLHAERAGLKRLLDSPDTSPADLRAALSRPIGGKPDIEGSEAALLNALNYRGKYPGKLKQLDAKGYIRLNELKGSGRSNWQMWILDDRARRGGTTKN